MHSNKDCDKDEMGNVNVEREKFEVREMNVNNSQIQLKIRLKGDGNKKTEAKENRIHSFKLPLPIMFLHRQSSILQ